MSTDTLSAIPEFLVKLKEETRAARLARAQQEKEAEEKAADENGRLLAEAARTSLGEQLAALVSFPTIASGTTETEVSLNLPGHWPVWTRFVRQSLDDNGQCVWQWRRSSYGHYMGKDLLWQVGDQEEGERFATLGEALLEADRGIDEDIPF